MEEHSLYEEIRTALVGARKRAGLSQKETAAALNMTRQNLSMFENSTHPPNLHNILKLLRFYQDKVPASRPGLLEDRLKRNYQALPSNLQAFVWVLLETLSGDSATQAVQPATPGPSVADSAKTDTSVQAESAP